MRNNLVNVAGGLLRVAVALLLVVPARTASVLLSHLAILFIFGKYFEAAALPGILTMAALPFVFLNAAFLSRSVARHASRMSLGIYAFTAAPSFLRNYFLGRLKGTASVTGCIPIREAVMTVLSGCFWNSPERVANPFAELQKT